ncbi:unnamed protein product [Ranitomeya imitator]|uniref:Cyclin-D-binding Myb-like transcription factor 1 N-terminal domain-containing protein n=1 Tax=Ranitomeya imitator TaxID=111125 RepID=A0ABN9LKM3_9NEOB|nr:unnamed protein product [Ranitomeya imitator]
MTTDGIQARIQDGRGIRVLQGGRRVSSCLTSKATMPLMFYMELTNSENDKLSMSTAEDEAGTVKVPSTRNALTLTQDLDGNLILHCPQNASEQDQSFEVTMTATTKVTEDDITADSITQIQILQNEQLADISPSGNDEVSAVSRAWFTSKEDKDSLTNKGHRWKQGMWSKEEISLLMSNIERYLKAHGIKDATEIIFEMSKDERKDFYRTIAWGLNRPLFAVYRRVLRMYDDRNHVGKYTHAEIERLRDPTDNGMPFGHPTHHTFLKRV